MPQKKVQPTPFPSQPASSRTRLGRPRAGHAGVIDARIVEAAREAFLEHGFAAASLEQIAQHAHISKMTLYGRYPTMVALFEGMMHRCVE